MQNTRPEWFVCGECLFYGEGDERYCHHTSRSLIDSKEAPYHFCENWTCRRCFCEWNEGLYDPANDINIYFDHTKCKPSVFK